MPRLVRVLVLFSASALAGSAHAATITVGPGCSLGQAIAAANADAAVGACAAGSGPDTIQLPPGVITFQTPWNLVTDPQSALPYVTSDIHFVGAGMDATILRRDPDAPDFHFLKLDAKFTYTLSDIGFENGRSDVGGAISYWYAFGMSGNVTIERCRFEDNDGPSTSAVNLRYFDSVVVRDSVFRGNQGSGGAALSVWGDTFSVIEITGSTFEANITRNTYGAVAASAPVVTLADNTFRANVTDQPNNSIIGARLSATVALTVRDTRFEDNVGGCALWVEGGQQGGVPYDLERLTFAGNRSSVSAAGLTAVTRAALTLKDSTFTDNQGHYQGGAALLGAELAESTTRVENCTFTRNTSLQGGALYVAGYGLTVIDGSRFDHNRGATIPEVGYGRAGAILVGAPTQITDSIFWGNDDPFPIASVVASQPSARESGSAGEFLVSTYTNGGAISADNVSWSVSQSCFVGNGTTAIVGPSTSDARNNWWGAADGPSGGGPGSGDTIQETVKHLPFLTSPPPACAGLVPDLPDLAVNAEVPSPSSPYATPIDDYAPLALPVLVDPASVGARLPIVPVNDALVEGPEIVDVNLVAGDGYIGVNGFPWSARVTIEDDGTGCGSSCDDGIACTVDVCDQGTLSCKSTPDHAACDDLKPCTVDTCSALGCSHTPDDSRCDDQNPCTADTCQAGVCAHTYVDGTCDDGDPCTTGTLCAGGQCVGGSTVPGCESRKVDLGAPFGEILLPVPTGGVCFSGSKIVPDCEPLGACQVDVNACFYPNETLVDVVIEAGLDAWGRVPFRGLWRSGGFCVYADLPNLGDGAVTTSDGSLVACWDGGGRGWLTARATAQSTSVMGISGTELTGSLSTTVLADETVIVSGCLHGETASAPIFAGLPGTFSTTSTLTLCVDGSAVVHLREWRPFRDDPSTLVTDVEANFHLDASNTWRLRIDHAFDRIVSLCRFLLKAGTLLAERLDDLHWGTTLRGTASFDFARQHVEATVVGTVSDEGLRLDLESQADLDLFLQWGDPQSDDGTGILVKARRSLRDNRLILIDRPVLPTLRLSCTPPATTVDIYGSTSFPICDQSLTASVTLHGELGQAAFTMTGQASVVGAFRFPAPLFLPGLPPLPGPFCLGLGSGSPPSSWAVCGRPPENGLWLHTTTTIPLLATTAQVELRAGLAPPETATAYARLTEPLSLIGPDDQVPGITSLTIGAGEVALDLTACGTGESGLSFATEATLQTTRGNAVTAGLSARIGTDRTALKLTTKGRWVEPFGLPGFAIEVGSDLAYVQSRTGPRSFRFGFDGLAYLLRSGSWPPESPVSDHGEVCNDVPAADEDNDGFRNCLDPDCQNHLLCRAGSGDAQLLALGTMLYFDSRREPLVPGGIPIPAVAMRFDVGRLLDWRTDIALPSLAEVDTDTSVLDADPELGFPDRASGPGGGDGRLTPTEREVLERVNNHVDRLITKLDLFNDGQRGALSSQPIFAEYLEKYVERVTALPDICVLIPLACQGDLSLNPLAKPRAVSFAAATRDVIFDGTTFAAGVHVIVRDQLPGGVLERHGSFGPNGLVLASYALADNPDGVEIYHMPQSEDLSWLRLGLTGDPYDRHATFPGDLTNGISVGPAAALAIAREGTVEGTVSRASITDGYGDAVLASHMNGNRGWAITLGDSGGTGFARVVLFVFQGVGLNLPSVTRTRLPVVPPGRPTHVAVTWEAVPVDGGGEELDVAIYVDGQRQPLDPLYRTALVPPEESDQPLLVGRGLQTLDDFRVWKTRRPALRIAGESLLMPPVSATSPDLVVHFDFNHDFGTLASNRGPLGASLPGYFGTGVGTAPDAGLAHSVVRLVDGDAATESSGYDAFAGLIVTTLFGTARFRVEAHVAQAGVAASLYAQEIPLMTIDHIGKACLIDVALAADTTAQTATGEAKAAICRDSGPSVLGTLEVTLACPAGTSCPNPPEGFVARATGTVGPVVITPEGTTPLTLSGSLSADTGSQEVHVAGRLEGGGFDLSGAITLTSRGLHVQTTIDPPPLYGVDLGPAACELDYQGLRFCGTCRTSTPACAVDLCLDFATETVTGDAPTCASVVIDKLPDGAPCVVDAMCQSGHCGLSASFLTPFCYTPGGGGDGDACDPGIPDQCASDFVCGAVCNPLNIFCYVPWMCLPPVDLGLECTADAQCDPGQVCRRPRWFLPRICLWQVGSREVGETCYGPDECRTNACVLGACVCVADYDCPSGEFCVAGICEAPPAPKRLPGQSCTTDSECLISHTNPNAGACVNGTCGCTSTADCQSSAMYCGLPVTDLPYSGVAPLGICLNKLPDGALCASGEMCRKDHCGGFLRPPVCYSPGTRRTGEDCVAHDECVTDRCQLDCNWGGACAPPPPGTPLTQPPPDCSCRTSCGCNYDNDCMSGWYCGTFVSDLGGVPGIRRCVEKGARGAYCAADHECQSGDCANLCFDGYCAGGCK